MKNKDKMKKATVSTCISKESPSGSEDDKSSTDIQRKKYPRKRVKKKDEYRNQVIEDQYGVFEYDKDPKGYLKARKRFLNRQSKHF